MDSFKKKKRKKKGKYKQNKMKRESRVSDGQENKGFTFLFAMSRMGN